MKRIVALLLVCCTLALVLVACGGGEETPSGTQAPTSKPTETDMYGQEALESKTDWESLDFDGEELTVMVRSNAEWLREWGKEEVGDDELDQAIYNRNEVVSDTLNLEVNLVQLPNLGYDDLREEVVARITRDVNNKLHEYDIVAHFMYVANQPALQDYQANLMDEDTFPYFNFDLPCWNQAMVKNVAVNDKIYAIAGDLNISMFNKAMVMWHNKDLFTEYRNAEEDPEDIQVLAMNGEWTYAELYRWSSYHNNADGSGDCGDIWGVYINNNRSNPMPFDAIPYAFDVSLITTNSDGTHAFNCVGNTKAEQAMQDWIKLYHGEGNGYNAQNCTCSLGTSSHFVDGKVLFMTDVLYRNEEYNIAIREMEDTYSILPIPKYTESQAGYYTTSTDGFTVVSVIDHSESSVATKGEAISAYLQYATEYSYTHVRGFYFERIVKPKFFGTDDSDGHVTNSITIFMTIINNLTFEFHTLYSPMLNDVAWLWRDTMYAEKTIQGQYEANKKNYEESLYNLDKWLGLIN